MLGKKKSGRLKPVATEDLCDCEFFNFLLLAGRVTPWDALSILPDSSNLFYKHHFSHTLINHGSSYRASLNWLQYVWILRVQIRRSFIFLFSFVFLSPAFCGSGVMAFTKTGATLSVRWQYQLPLSGAFCSPFMLQIALGACAYSQQISQAQLVTAEALSFFQNDKQAYLFASIFTLCISPLEEDFHF